MSPPPIHTHTYTHTQRFSQETANPHRCPPMSRKMKAYEGGGTLQIFIKSPRFLQEIAHNQSLGSKHRGPSHCALSSSCAIASTKRGQASGMEVASLRVLSLVVTCFQRLVLLSSIVFLAVTASLPTWRPSCCTIFTWLLGPLQIGSFFLSFNLSIIVLPLFALSLYL